MTKPPEVCKDPRCCHKGRSLSLAYFRKGSSEPNCYVYHKRCSDCRKKPQIHVPLHFKPSPLKASCRKCTSCRQEWSSLNAQQFLLLQGGLNHVKYIILDEKSMIGRRLLSKVDSRFRDGFPHQQDDYLGGCSTLMFRDFGQLPPVGRFTIIRPPSVRWDH